jgi:hypothetical protein
VNPYQNAKFALVIAEYPKLVEFQGVDERKWKGFLFDLPRFAPPSKETTKIHDNVWLIPLNGGMPFLVQLFQYASGMDIPLRILFLDAEPDWIRYPSPVAAAGQTTIVDPERKERPVRL